MDNSREDSPDWLRCFQAPAQSALTISSGSESLPDETTISEDEKDNDRDGEESPIKKTSKVKSPNKKLKADSIRAKKRKRDNHIKREGNRGDGKIAKQETPEKPKVPRMKAGNSCKDGHNEIFKEPNHSVWTLSSDSESCPGTGSLREDNIFHEELSAQEKTHYPAKEKDKDAVDIEIRGESLLNEASTMKSPKKRLKTEDRIPTKKNKANDCVNRGIEEAGFTDKENDGDIEVAEEEISEKQIGPYVSSSRLPLVLSEKVQRSKALVECEGDSIDLSGDVGAVGRIVISDNPSRNDEMFLDLKGTIYKTTIVPSRTFCVVSFGQSEAKIEAIMNDFIQLKPQSNVYEAETMVEGTLDGFSFDSEDEADNLRKASTHQTDQNEDAEQQSNGKGRGKAEKKSGAARKKGKTGGGKPPKKVKKKSQVPKKTKTKK